ncbi:MAG TPA: ABC transporter permease [Anaerolineae bacterium]|nr:ABC transporter permease [Anaerolineae bacterium]
MIRFLIRRTLWAVLIIFLFATVMFFLIQIIIPQDFTVQFALSQSRAQREAMQEELGLNLPLWQQYFNWISNFFNGTFGESFYGYPVVEILKATIPVSLLLFLTGTALAFVIGLALGRFIGWRGSGPVTSLTTFGGIALYTTFPPWLAWLVTYFIGRRIRFFRSVFGSGPFSGLDFRIWGDSPLSPSMVSWRMVVSLIIGTLVLLALNALLHRLTRRSLPTWIIIPLIGVGAIGSWYALGFDKQALDILSRAAIPTLTYTALSFGETMLIMRTSMADTLEEEYITVARAKGLPERIVRNKHAVRNAILPVVSRLVITLPYLMTGVVIIEDVFGWPGVGSVLFDSLNQQDMPIAMAILLFVGVFSLISRLLLDILLAYFDPRIRYQEPTTLPSS